MKRGSYLAANSSLKQTRKPVLLIYCRKEKIKNEASVTAIGELTEVMFYEERNCESFILPLPKQ